MDGFETLITSVPDQDGLVAEIWHDGALFAEFRQAENGRRIMFYADRADVDFDALTAVLQAAAGKLQGGEKVV